MTPPLSIRTTPHFERLFRKLLRGHSELRAIRERIGAILVADPHNRTGTYPIKKLQGVALGEGQWRLSLGRFRFRYDIYRREVVLQRCSLRREDTYE